MVGSLGQDAQREWCLDIWIALAGEATAKIYIGWIMSRKTCKLLGFHIHGGENPGQGRLEGYHEKFAATHLIYGL